VVSDLWHANTHHWNHDLLILILTMKLLK
jgi:hypothetical protein